MMLAHRSLGVKVIGDINIWQNEWTDETYQYFAVEKMRFAKVRDENGKLVADKTRIIYNMEKSEYAVTANDLKNKSDIPILLFLACTGYQ